MDFRVGGRKDIVDGRSCKLPVPLSLEEAVPDLMDFPETIDICNINFVQGYPDH